jgi:hypothetical protein
LVSFGYDGGTCRLSETQQDRLKAWITETLPRTTGANRTSGSGQRAVIHDLLCEDAEIFVVQQKANGFADLSSQAVPGLKKADWPPRCRPLQKNASVG